MAAHDTIGDFLTIIRNGYNGGRNTVSSAYSRQKEGIAKILQNEGYIEGFEVVDIRKGVKEIRVALKYVNGTAAIVGIERFSKPGCRLYRKYNDLPRVIGGLGISILTTSKGILRDRDARRMKLGGEVLCKVW